MLNKIIYMDFLLMSKLGALKGIIITYFVARMINNKKRKSNYHDDKYWVYESAQSLTEKLNICSANTIRKCLKELETAGIIITANYNKRPYDKTKWFSVIEHTILQDLGFYKMTVSKLSKKKEKSMILEETKQIPEGTRKIPEDHQEFCQRAKINPEMYYGLSNDITADMLDNIKSFNYKIEHDYLPEAQKVIDTAYHFYYQEYLRHNGITEEEFNRRFPSFV